MGYLFFQTLFWIVLAFLLGLLLGWLLRGVICGRDCKDDESGSVNTEIGAVSGTDTSSASSAASASTGAAASVAASAAKPAKAATTTKKMSPAPTKKASAKSKPAAGSAEAVKVTDDMRPQGLSAPNGTADDLKRIRGVGPVIEKTLNGLGVYHFTQVADFTEDNIKWVDNFISFPGRIKREEWVSQAADLASGTKTEFASRYDKGEVGENNPNN